MPEGQQMLHHYQIRWSNQKLQPSEQRLSAILETALKQGTPETL